MLPMSFLELDDALLTAAASTASGKREKKRKTATIARLNPEVSVTGSNVDENTPDGWRTGRWTNDEMVYCDMLMDKFETGELPVADGIKLNDFLANMLKSKQSRLTKKMKNAKLSARSYKRTTGYIIDDSEAKAFSELENAFYRSIACSMEKAEIRFHLQKEWREIFSSYCVQVGQKLEADDWLSSVEEMDRRASRAKDAAKMARRKRMMGYALEQDQMHPVQGVFIETSKATISAEHPEVGESDEMAAAAARKRQRGLTGPVVPRKHRVQPPPFLGRLLTYMQRHSVPFEYIDAWVPSFVAGNQAGQPTASQNCRLCFAGCATSEMQVASDGRNMLPLSKEDQFDLNAFGEYSQKFSFDVGCGLPGRVYHTGVPSWEQSVQNAPIGHFERSGGAVQWGIKTVLGIPVPSPNVGRIVVLFYSRHDRPQNPDMAARIVEEMTKLMPSPKWKLVVDVGAMLSIPPTENDEDPVNPSQIEGKQDVNACSGGAEGLLKLLTELMPTTMTSPLSPYLPGFTSLRMILLKPTKTHHEEELLHCMIQSFESYLSTGRSQQDLAMLVVRDFMAMTQEQHVFQNAVSTAAAVPPTPIQSPQYQQQLQSQLQHQQVLQFQHSQMSQHGGASQAMNFSHGGGAISIEPTPVSQMRAMSAMVPQQHQQQQIQGSGHQFQQNPSSQGNGGNQPYLLFNAK